MDNRIAKEKEFFVVFPVPVPVPFNLVNPVVWMASFFQAGLKDFPIFSVEKFTVAENGNLIFGQHDVGGTGKLFEVFAVAVSAVP